MNRNETDLDSILAEFSDSGTDYIPEKAHVEAVKTVSTPSAATGTAKKLSVPMTQPHPEARSQSHKHQDHSSSSSAQERHSHAHYVPPKPAPEDETEPEPRPKKALTRKQKRKRRNIITLIFVCLLILAGAAGIFLTLTHKSQADTVKQEINLTERVEKTVEENEASVTSTKDTITSEGKT